MRTFGDSLEEVCAVQNGHKAVLSKLPNPGYIPDLVPQLTHAERVARVEELIEEFFAPARLSTERIRLWLEVNKDYTGPYDLSFLIYLGLHILQAHAKIIGVKNEL